MSFKNIKYLEILKYLNSNYSDLNKTGKQVYLLSNLVIDKFRDLLNYFLKNKGLDVEIKTGEYNNIVQSSFNSKKVDIIFLFWDASNIVEDFHYKIYNYSNEDLKNIEDSLKKDIQTVFLNLSTVPKVFFNSFSTTFFTDITCYENKFEKFCNNINLFIKKNLPPNFILMDLNKVINEVSIEHSFNKRDFYSTKAPYTLNFYKSYLTLIETEILFTLGITKKVLVLDCDNTLWGGVIGEDGLDGIELSNTSPKGKFFFEIQNMLKYLKSRGVILSICSKNNKEDVIEVFEKHPQFLLKTSDFVIINANWEDKVSNIKNIAQQLNLGLESFVFIDDSDFETTFVKRELPSVTVYKVPERLYDYPSLFRKILNLFNPHVYTSEDQSRTLLYKIEQKRKESESNFNNIDEYLYSLGLKLYVSHNVLDHIQRVSQLTQKTNQFNLTTKRYTSNEINSFISDPNTHVLDFRLKDNFGDYGIIGLVIFTCKDSNLYLDTLLLSCRSLGRGVEYEIINVLVLYAKKLNIKTIKAEYIKTPKNVQVQNFLIKSGMIANYSDKQRNKYSTKTSKIMNHKTNIKTIVNDI